MGSPERTERVHGGAGPKVTTSRDGWDQGPWSPVPGGRSLTLVTTRIVILGGGTGGTLAANRLRRQHRADDVEITVVDRDDQHVYQPGLLFVPFGLAAPDEIVRPRHRQLHRGIRFLEADVDHVDLADEVVHLGDGSTLGYDVLVVASGARLLPEETEGLTGPGWMGSVFTFYTPEGAAGLASALERFEGGRLVVDVVDMPIKCPVAPLELRFLADWYFTERGIRDRVQITFATPLDAAFTKPVAAGRLGGCSRSGASSWSPTSPRPRWTGREVGWSATTVGRSASTSPWWCPSTVGPPTSRGRPASVTSSGSSPPTRTIPPEAGPDDVEITRRPVGAGGRA